MSSTSQIFNTLCFHSHFRGMGVIQNLENSSCLFWGSVAITIVAIKSSKIFVLNQCYKYLPEVIFHILYALRKLLKFILSYKICFDSFAFEIITCSFLIEFEYAHPYEIQLLKSSLCCE